jgi:hypothetical protein
MGEWLARVHFPNGRVRYARYSTVVEALGSDLYDHFRARGGHDDLGNVVYRATVAGEPSPADPGAPLSEPQGIIPVRIEVEPDNMRWPALYCPRRNQIVGPHSQFVAARVQQAFNLVRQDATLHLVPVDGAEQALCGAPAAGEVVPFFRYAAIVYQTMGTSEESKPAPRDLYAEWGDGHVCQRCLLHEQALNADGV